MKRSRKNIINRGKTCSSEGCNGLARTKGLCVSCYQKNRYKQKKEKQK